MNSCGDLIFTFVHLAGNAKRENSIESFNDKFRDEFLDESGSSGGPRPTGHWEVEGHLTPGKYPLSISDKPPPRHVDSVV